MDSNIMKITFFKVNYNGKMLIYLKSPNYKENIMWNRRYVLFAKSNNKSAEEMAEIQEVGEYSRWIMNKWREWEELNDTNSSEKFLKFGYNQAHSLFDEWLENNI